MLKIKRVYEPVAPEDGRRILVERLWPRGMKKEALALDEWLKEAAPSPGLRKWYSHDPGRFGEFRLRYRRELEDRPDLLERLRAQAREGTVTLLYATRDPQLNSARLLKELLEE